ncbi:hypothetical protein AD006_31195 (plasmid) [Pseudonocardia sp. EC080610-09]|uniref:hypothetical protein n=1 Tax=unclassified Pseudonocardia TaxID=2619320 RepID=UPI000706AC91|nr:MULTISPECIES: hypothetical protein [unclassified Pseudonocardia]ALL79650.1 hypothetical protein AD006_31195 [Pseudonocardia sp. EC080610-09]ALL85393.1 hypothetical protein AD017_30040 [Pseudonocardia sp. EC080619-01]
MVEAESDSPPTPHSHHNEPVCHQDGTQDESALTARADRPAIPDIYGGAGILAVVVADLQSQPSTDRRAASGPARIEGGRQHLVLAQISRT